MSRTERTRWSWLPSGDGYLDPNGRDHGTNCWCCTKWKRPARKRLRAAAKRLIRRDPEGA